MNTAKLVNSALTGGGLIYPENLNVVIGSENKGYPKGTVLDANATLSLAGSNSSNGQQQESNLGFQIITNNFKNPINNKDTSVNNILLESSDDYRKNIIISSNEFGNYKNSHISGFCNIIIGLQNTVTGVDNIVLGRTIIEKGSYNITNGRRTIIPIIKNTENNKIRIKAKIGSSLIELLEKGFLYALAYLSVKNEITQRNDNQEMSVIQILNYTRISDEVIQLEDPGLEVLKDSEKIVLLGISSESSNTIISGELIQAIKGDKSISVGHALRNEAVNNVYPNTYQLFGTLNTVKSDFEFACGSRNVSTKNDNFSTRFSVGVGLSKDDYRNGFEIGYKKVGTTFEPNIYVLGIGGYDGKNAANDSTKSLQQVISDIETAVSLNSNGPWDIDITSEFVNGNVTIYTTQMWNVNQASKRVYFLADLKQGDAITIPDTLRMYIGWKKADGTFGLADWATAAKKYTVTVDGKYVILVANNIVSGDVQTNTLPSFGKIMLRTSNPEFKPTAQTDAKKDHTNDDKVMRGIAHQGFHKLERANSLAAFRAAAKEGWRYVETDTYMTSDGKFIVSHDPYLPTGWTNGTTTTTQGSYKYEEHTLAEILAFHGPNNENTDTLEEFCKTCKECGLHPYIEIKQGKMADPNTLDTTNPRYSGKGYCIKILDIVNRCGLRGNATFIASVPYTLLLMARVDQNYRYGIVYFYQLKKSDAQWTTVLSKIDEYNNDAAASKAYLFLDANINNLKVADADAVDTLALKNCALEVWTATTKDDLNNLDPYVTGVTSDNIHAGEILAKKI